MKKLIDRIDRDDIIFLTLTSIVFIAFIGGVYGNQFAADIFKQTWVAIPTYLGLKGKSEDKDE